MIKDFDSVLKEERKVRISGEDIDVTKIPSRVSLEMARLSDSQEELNSEEGFYKAIDMVSQACKPSNSKITADWLLDNTDFETLMDFMEYVLEPIRRRTEQTEQNALKNMKAQASKKKKST